MEGGTPEALMERDFFNIEASNTGAVTIDFFRFIDYFTFCPGIIVT